jgi:hypothetical protein
VIGACVDFVGLSPDNAVVEKFNNTGGIMATVNFSVPDDVKRQFDRAFIGKNKSRVIADLMARAVEEQQAAKRRTEAIEALLARRRTKRPVKARELRVAREAGRP